jgi:tryprostatin B 6-hydroxylase
MLCSSSQQEGWCLPGPETSGYELTDHQFPMDLDVNSDTTATSLTSIVYELARRPDEVDKLRAEMEPIEADSDGEYEHDKLAKLPHLNGFINEAFRLHSPIPGVIPRKTPPEGIHVKDIFIPGNMTVFSPQWSMGRCTGTVLHSLNL